MSNQEKPATKIVTGKVRLSYANIWTPKPDQQGALKYSAAILIPKSDKETLRKIKAAIEAAKQAGITKLGDKNGKIPPNIKSPLRDGDIDKSDDPVYAGHYFINANSTQAPGIIDRNRQPILDQDEVYSGCYARVSVNFFAFNTSGNKGIGCWLNHIQKVADGEPLSGRGRAEDDFNDDFDFEDDFLS